MKKSFGATIESCIGTYPHLRELALICVEWYKNLVRKLVSEILPQHVKILCLHVQQIVSGPLALIDLIQRVHERLRGGLHRCKTKRIRRFALVYLIRFSLASQLSSGKFYYRWWENARDSRGDLHGKDNRGGRFCPSRRRRCNVIVRTEACCFASRREKFFHADFPSRRHMSFYFRNKRARRGWLLSWPTSKPLLVHSPAAISRLLTNSSLRLAPRKSCRVALSFASKRFVALSSNCENKMILLYINWHT